MKPKAFLHSCDKKFESEFIKLTSEKLDTHTDSKAFVSYDYYYYFLSDNRDQLEALIPTFKNNTKSVLVCSQKLKSTIDSYKNLPNLKVIYYSQLLMQGHESLASEIIKSSKSGLASVPVSNFPLNVVSVSELVAVMLEASFTYYSQSLEEFFVTNDLSFHSLVNHIRQLNPDLTVEVSNQTFNLPELPDKKISVKTDYQYLSNFYETVTVHKTKREFPKISLNINFVVPSLPKMSFDKLLKYFALASSIPVALFLISGISLYLGYSNISKNSKLSSLAFDISKKSSLNTSFRESAELGERVLAVTDSTEFDFESATPDELRLYLSNLKTNLNSLYKDMSFGKDSFIFSDLILDSRETVLKVHDVLDVSSILLGLNREESFAVLFTEGNLVTGVMYAEIKDAKVEYMRYISSAELDSLVSGEINAPFDSQQQWSFEDVLWYGDFNVVSENVRWFIDKSINLNPTTIFVTTNENLDLFKNRIVSGSSIMDLDFLSKLLTSLNNNQIAANSLNVQLQSFFNEQSMSSSILGSGNEFIFDEFSENGLSSDIDRKISAKIDYHSEGLNLIIDVSYKNNATDIYNFWPKIHLSEDITVSKVNYLLDGENIEAYPSIKKIGKLKTIANNINLEGESELLVNYTFKIKNYSLDESSYFKFSKLIYIPKTNLSVDLISNFTGVVNTIPTMNLTSTGALRYTTALEEPLTLEIKINK